MQHGTVRLHDATLNFTRWGEGAEVLLAFHGFGQHRGYFGPLAEALGETHTLYAFDLFFHGESTWRTRNGTLTKARWTELVAAFLRQQGVTRFGLLGFSMGGKFVLATLEAMPERVTRVVLLAPDGIKTSFWYSLATYPGWTDRFFPARYREAGRLPQPGPLHSAASASSTRALLRLSPKAQMKHREQQPAVVPVLDRLREMHFDLQRVGGVCSTCPGSLVLYLGPVRRSIPKRNMGRLLGRCAPPPVGRAARRAQPPHCRSWPLTTVRAGDGPDRSISHLVRHLSFA
jgi:pimeloyl-ACP methyl ester carboxylesterase